MKFRISGVLCPTEHGDIAFAGQLYKTRMDCVCKIHLSPRR